MLDFSALPPEIISGRLFTGPGPGSLLVASTAWANVATELESFASGYSNTLGGLAGVWQGPSAVAMTAAAFPFISWAYSTAAMAAQSSLQALAAANAFETALTSVVHPAVIATNRMYLASLVATNILGQNGPAIMAIEAQYAQMWAQDVVTMIGYQTSSQAATSQLSPAVAAPASTGSAASALGSIFNTLFGVTPGEALYGTFQSAVSSGFPLDIAALIISALQMANVSDIAGAVTNNANALGGRATAIAPSAPTGGTPPGPVTAITGNSNRIGPLSTPPSWGEPTTPKPVSPLPRYQQPRPKEEPVGYPVIPAVPVAGGKGAPRKKGTDPDSMDYGRPSPPVLYRHPSGG